MNTKITKPDDFHVHLRDGNYLTTTVAHCATQFARALVMPNLITPITDVRQAQEYRQRILNAVPKNLSFEPLMSLYLTDNMQKNTITEAKKSGFIYACKLYPAGATTHSQSGVTNITNIFSVLETMQNLDLPLLVHGEVTSDTVDIFDREKIFIDTVLVDLIKKFPNLRIVLEHISTKDAVDFVRENQGKLAATITAHHLLINRNDLFVGGLRPHNYCLPIVKRKEHQLALINAATGDCEKFFLGTDSAPHPISKKEASCGCAGIYTSHAAIELYASVFEQEGKLEKLEEFSSVRGAKFYQLPYNTQTITLTKQEWTVPELYPFDDESLIPFFANKKLPWRVQI